MSTALKLSAGADAPLCGRAAELAAALSKRKGGGRYAAVALGERDAERAQWLTEQLQRAAELLDLLAERREAHVLEQLLEALVPAVPLPEHALREARHTAAARRAVLEACEWLSAAQIAELAGFSPSNPSAQPNRWKSQGQVFAIRQHGLDYFPAYALDADAGYRPRKELAAILKKLTPHKDGWGLAYWFASVNGHLGGARPLDRLAEAPRQVLAAAAAEAERMQHG